MKQSPVLFAVFVFAACAHPGRGMRVATESVRPGSSVSANGVPVELYPGSLAIGDDMPARLRDAGIPMDFAGRVTVVSVVPSIDTRVCEAQTHILGETRILSPLVDRVTLSRDLPMAQARFAKEAKLTGVRFLSDFKSGEFGKSAGLLMKGKELLARGVVVLDSQGIVRYVQIVPEITSLPDMDAAFAAANRLAAAR